MNENAWENSLHPSAVTALKSRDYSAAALSERLQSAGLEAGQVLANKSLLIERGAWIPGVELVPRNVYPQRHRGFFSELGREGEGRIGELGFWPKQWASATMYAGTAKGFHIHPPYLPDGVAAEEWFQKLYQNNNSSSADRPYDKEQWDLMHFVAGRCQFLLRDERRGLPRRIMVLWIDGDNHRGDNNVSLLIPAGVAHAIKAEGSEDLVMVYGTSTTFNPAWEGRIGSEVEAASLPTEWTDYLAE
ncbi:MAG: hypothetical protein ACFCU3_02870 [Verrucomicrobiales bacterium]